MNHDLPGLPILYHSILRHVSAMRFYRFFCPQKDALIQEWTLMDLTLALNPCTQRSSRMVPNSNRTLWLVAFHSFMSMNYCVLRSIFNPRRMLEISEKFNTYKKFLLIITTSLIHIIRKQSVTVICSRTVHKELEQMIHFRTLRHKTW